MKIKILVMSMLAMAVTFTSCGGDDDDEEEEVAPVFQAKFTSEGGVRHPAPAKVIFTNTSTLATSYSWDFGDGNTSTEENPTHTFEEAGTYNVVLTAKNDAGEERTREKEFVIYDTPTHIKISSMSMKNAAIEALELTEGSVVYLKLKKDGTEYDYTGEGTYKGGTVTALTDGDLYASISDFTAEVNLGSTLTIEFIDGNRSTLATYELKVNDLIPEGDTDMYPAMYQIEKDGELHVQGNSEWYVNSTPFDN